MKLVGRDRGEKSRFELKKYISYPKVLARGKFPLDISVESADVYSSRDVDALSEVIDVL